MTDSAVRQWADHFDVYTALSSPRRRMILYLLHEEDDVEDLDSLATHIAAREHDSTTLAVTGEQRRRVYISLYQTHLPQLVGEGYITHDTQTGQITPNGWTRGLIPLMDELAHLDAERPTSEGDDDDGAGFLEWLREWRTEEADS